MKNAKWWMGLLAVVVMAGSAVADEITLQQAETAVGNWIARGGAFGKLAGHAEVAGETFEDPDTGAKMHVVRIPGKGFAVTSADDGIEPIILFSDGEGEFVAEEGNPLWDLLRWDLAARQKALKEETTGESGNIARRGMENGGAGAFARQKWTSLLSESGDSQKRGSPRVQKSNGGAWKWMDPLLTTRWMQGEGNHGDIYNMFTPIKTKVTTVPAAQSVSRALEGWVADTLVTNELGHYPVGCVAVAGGQVMKYWEHPKSAKTKTVACLVDGEKQTLQFWGSQYADGFDGPERLNSYNWLDMGSVEPHWILPNSSEYVSRLLSDIGVTCGAHYKMSGTSIALSKLASEMKSTFSYSSAVYHTTNLVGGGLQEVLIPNLDAGAPVMLGIGHAHAVVVDAYGFIDTGSNTGSFIMHINLGWGGENYRNWYIPPEIETEIATYTTIDEIVCNVFPTNSGVILSGRVTGPNGWAVYDMDVSCGGYTARTDTEGLYHFILSPGTYHVTATNAWRSTITAGPQPVVLPEMTQTVNGNRILNFIVTNAPTVLDIVRMRPGATAKGTEITFSEPFEVTLSCPTKGAEIHYTLDGSIPRGNDPVYEGPILIYDTTTLRAVAIAPGMERSKMLEETYTFKDPQSRDNFANARPISGANGRTSFGNAGYTLEAGEPIHAIIKSDAQSFCYTPGGASAWASWTAPADGDWTFWLDGIGTNGASCNPQMAVYTGTEINHLNLVAANDDSPQGGNASRLSFHATGGTEYKIAMDTYKGSAATLTLRWEEGYVHWVKPQYEVRFVSRSGGRVEIGVESTTRWRVMEYTDLVDPETMGGENGDLFAFSVPANGTGKERSGTVTFQAGDSDLVTLTIVQHPSVDFATTQDEAWDRAWRENKQILLIKGRETCPNTRGTLFSSIPSAAVKTLIDTGYVIWYSNCDVQSDASVYTAGLSYYLPFICIIDPRDMSTYTAKTMGPQDSSQLQVFLSSHSAWSGLPTLLLDVVRHSTTSATATTKVRAWGTGASSATVTLETSDDAAFSSVKSTRQLGTITKIWTEQEWTFGPPSPTKVAYCRLRITSGDWSVVSDVVEFMPLGIALDNESLIFSSEGEAPWLGETSVSHDGVDAARCENPTTDDTGMSYSWLKTEVQGPGRLSFWWKTDGNSGSLEFVADGRERMTISATSRTWTERSWNFVDTTQHKVAWRLYRSTYNGMYSVTGWVDQVTWTPGNIVILDRAIEYDTSQTVLAIRGEAMPTVAVPTKTGYTFGGYFSGMNGTGTRYYTSSGTSAQNWDQTANATLHAYWIPKTYTLTFDRQGGTGGTASVTAPYGEFPPTVDIPVQSGFDFTGYYTSTDEAGEQYYNASGMAIRRWKSETNATLYARWQGKADVVWEYQIEDGKALVTGVTPASGKLSMPAVLGGCPVYGFETYAFSRATNLLEIAIADKVKNIGYAAFYDCSQLASVTLPNSATNIDDLAFYYCSRLASITIPAGVRSIGAHAFEWSGLTSVTLSKSVTNIGFAAFSHCYDLTQIHVANENPTFASEDGVLFSKDKTTLLGFPGGRAGGYEIPGFVTRIANAAFSNSISLTSVTIPNSVNTIGEHAFYYCFNLGSAIIPDSVTNLGRSAFEYCSALKRLEVPGAWWGSDKVANASVPSGCEVVYRGINPLSVVTTNLPTGAVGEGYKVALEATGGVAPYTWSAGPALYAETTAAGTFVKTGTAQGWQADDGCWDLALPFAFPFFGHSYTHVKVNSNGALSFGNSIFTAYSYTESAFKASPIIAVLWRDLTTSTGDIFVSSRTDSVTVRWQGTYIGGGDVNCSATLCKDGRIVLTYGPGNENSGYIGLSAGDGTMYQLSARSGSGSLENATDVVFTPSSNPIAPGLKLTTAGILQGTPTVAGEYAFSVMVTDSKGVTATKQYSLTVQDAVIPVDVPATWLEKNAAGILAANGGDYEKAANAKATNGRKVWECYVAGLDPESEEDFRAVLKWVDGKPVVESSLGVPADRAVKIEGRKSMADDESGQAWTDVTGVEDLRGEGWRFFRVGVELAK